eukprot:2046854-Pleurochrysis_carterae.AAC.1
MLGTLRRVRRQRSGSMGGKKLRWNQPPAVESSAGVPDSTTLPPTTTTTLSADLHAAQDAKSVEKRCAQSQARRFKPVLLGSGRLNMCSSQDDLQMYA